MHDAISQLLQRYDCRTLAERKNALREILQELALLGLYRGGFFSVAAFNGGTALRIFHRLDRFSEDLDFSLADIAALRDFAERCSPTAAMDRPVLSVLFALVDTPTELDGVRILPVATLMRAGQGTRY